MSARQRTLALVPAATPFEDVAALFAGVADVVIVGASEPRFCMACREEQRMRFRAGWWHGRIGVTACPHCCPSPESRAIPLVVLSRWYDDTPNGDVA